MPIAVLITLLFIGAGTGETIVEHATRMDVYRSALNNPADIVGGYDIVDAVGDFATITRDGNTDWLVVTLPGDPHRYFYRCPKTAMWSHVKATK